MDRRWIVLGLVALLCVQGFGKPTDNADEDSYQDDDGEGEENDDDDVGEDVSDSQGSSVPVEVLTKPQLLIATPGSRVVIPCKFKNADGLMVTWKKDVDTLLFAGSTNMGQDERLSLANDNTSGLVIDNVQESDSSTNYECTALDNDLQKKVRHRLLVVPSGTTYPTRVIVQPGPSFEAEQGQDVTIACETYGTAEPKSMRWSRKGERIKESERTSTGIYINIRNASSHLAGTYQCMVETGASVPLTGDVTLKVKHIPRIVYETEQVREGRMRDVDHYYTGIGPEVVTNISCVVHSHPPVTELHWYKNGQKLRARNHHGHANDDTHDKHLEQSSPLKGHHVLSIHGTSKSDLGTYHCEAINSEGRTIGPHIFVVDTPSKPIFSRGYADSDNIYLHWNITSYRPVYEAELQYRMKGEQNWKDLEDVKVVSAIGNHHVVQGKFHDIDAGEYEARLRARNDRENAEDSNNLIQESTNKKPEWGPFSSTREFDVKQLKSEAEGVRGSAMRPTFSLMPLLFIIAPLVRSCL